MTHRMYTFLQLNNNTNTMRKSFFVFALLFQLIWLNFQITTPAHRGACKKENQYLIYKPYWHVCIGTNLREGW